MILTERNFLKYKFSFIENFIKKFNIKDFNNKAKVKKYFDFFDLEILIKKQLKYDRIKVNKNFGVFIV